MLDDLKAFAGSTSDGAAVFVQVASEDADTSWQSFIGMIYEYYASQNILNDTVQEIMASDRLEDNFQDKFMQVLLTSLTSSLV